MWEADGFKVLQQLLIPGVSGAVGGLALVVMASLNQNFEEYKLTFIEKIEVCIKFLFLGSVAGVAAVNLLNPGGNISQVMVLALIAGLSAYSYLERTALIDNIHKDIVFKKFKKKLISSYEKLVKKAGEEVASLRESSIDLDDEKTEGIEVILRAKDEEIQEYINAAMEEFVNKYPTASEDQIYGYYKEVVQKLDGEKGK